MANLGKLTLMVPASAESGTLSAPIAPWIGTERAL